MTPQRFSKLCGVGLALLVGFNASAVHADTLAQPELPSGVQQKSGLATRSYAVAAANPLATQAGQAILQAGGSAVDAAVAVQMVLALVEPQSSGIGGGAFLLHFDGRHTQAFDGRETAPAAATPRLFLNEQGAALPFMEAVVGGRSVGVPGAVAMLYAAHRQHGKLPWKALFAPAIRLAKEGFAVSPRMATLLAGEKSLQQDAVARAYFYDADGKPWPAGHVLKNPELADVLEAIAHKGPAALLKGELAKAMVQKVQSHANRGTLALGDLAAYQPLKREPLCFDYRAQNYYAQESRVQTRNLRICGMPPPSSGTLAIGQILGILDASHSANIPLQDGLQNDLQDGLPNAQWLHLYTEAARLAFADRAQFVADPAFVAAPGGSWHSLLDSSYLASRAAAIDTTPGAARMPAVTPGNPGRVAVGYAPMPQQTEYGTSHISIIDKYGNALAMTSTIEDAWGSRLMVNRGKGKSGGFLLNNQLTDFSFVPSGADGQPIANRVEPGKRPRSSMSPVLVFDKASGQVLLSAGSPGGAMIIHFTAKTLYGMLNWGLNAQQAINLPNFGTVGGPLVLEQGGFPASTVEALRQRGHTVNETPMPSGLQAIMRTPSGFFGGADPRREGLVLGD